MKYKFKASIFFKDNNNKERYFSDIYYFNSSHFNIKYDFDYITGYIKNDLLLVAGGGYKKIDANKTRIFIYQV
jgi:hypothetical protein